LSQKNTEVASPDTHHGIAAIAFAFSEAGFAADRCPVCASIRRII
jgi:hypothetical protein